MGRMGVCWWSHFTCVFVCVSLSLSLWCIYLCVCVYVRCLQPCRSKDFKRISKFVAHTDDLLPMLTVRETLMYAAELQLPPGFSKTQKSKLVQYTIRDLGLEICADTFVGGGERDIVFSLFFLAWVC